MTLNLLLVLFWFLWGFVCLVGFSFYVCLFEVFFFFCLVWGWFFGGFWFCFVVIFFLILLTFNSQSRAVRSQFDPAVNLTVISAMMQRTGLM